MTTFFKELTEEKVGNSRWYCSQDKCVTCKYSYGPINFEQDLSKHLMCARWSIECEYRPLDKVELKKVVDRIKVASDNPSIVKYQYIVEEG